MSLHRRKLFVCSVRELVDILKLEPRVYEHRPDWQNEYLVFRQIPRELISDYTRDEFEDRMLLMHVIFSEFADFIIGFVTARQTESFGV